jgi:hypothetical protein
MDHQDRIYFKGLARTSGQAVNNFKRFIFSTSKRLGKNKNGQIDENFDLSTQVNRIGLPAVIQYSCEFLTQGCRFRCAESGCFHCSLSRASSASFTIKKADLLRRVGILVNRIGQMSNHFFEDLKLLTALVA